MGAILSTYANEKGTFVITITWKDEDGNAITPTSATWTLTDTDGNVINSRTAVSIAVPSTSNAIVLSGSDLVVIDGDRELILTTEFVYNSANGTGLPGKSAVGFIVKDLKAVT